MGKRSPASIHLSEVILDPNLVTEKITKMRPVIDNDLSELQKVRVDEE